MIKGDVEMIVESEMVREAVEDYLGKAYYGEVMSVVSVSQMRNGKFRIWTESPLPKPVLKSEKPKVVSTAKPTSEST